MSSGTFKNLTKVLTAALPSVSLPLPDDIIQVIHAYLDKHADHNESACQRLQDELLSMYENHVLDNPSRIAPFMAILRSLKPNIRGSGRFLQWWEKLSGPIMLSLGDEKGLARVTRDTLLDVLVEDEEDKDSITTSAALADNLMSAWLKNNNSAMVDFDDKARFIEAQIKDILLAFGRRRSKDFLTTIDKYFVEKESRIATLGLICEFIRNQPPHLHQMLQTSLFDNILRCLQIDTSTRAISLAMTALVMFLPHIPNSSGSHLPALFNIYSRMLFWDRERRAALETTSQNSDDGITEKPHPNATEDKLWQKLPYLLESDDDTVPELLHYFTFLYGLYPINFMAYIRKPQKYLRHAKFPGADELDVQPTEIRERSETFREVHLLHPNFFTMTIESELTENNRWMKSDPADIVAECMALYSPGEDNVSHASRSRRISSHRNIEPNADIPEEPLLDYPDATTTTYKHTSWRNTQSTAVASPEPSRSSHCPGLHRKGSQTSQSPASAAESPLLYAADRLDSPTLPPQMMSSQPALKDILTSQASARGSIYRVLTNDSMHSFAHTHDPDNSYHIDADLESLTRGPIGPSPALRPTSNEPSTRIAYLHREIQLLHNDLNFERYLKQQHLAHIGQLRQKQIREARVEAETQNLINSNRSLKSRLEDMKRDMLQMRNETEKSKSHSRKWEAELSSKLRVLREEQKKWLREKEELTMKLSTVEKDAGSLRDIIVNSEARELGCQQKMNSIELNLDELAYLKGEIEKLTLALRKYEANELQATLDKEKEEALGQGTLSAMHNIAPLCMDSADVISVEVHLLKLKLRARDEELTKAQASTDNEARMNNRITPPVRKSSLPEETLEAALSVSKKRVVEIQKAHSHLISRYNTLQEAYLDLKETYELETNNQEAPPLLGGPRSPVQSKSQKASQHAVQVPPHTSVPHPQPA
ncbi:Hamartin protein-domain-containing protein [Calycina marina]|uniref:Hamartin protein-domain-containing protein n=1 Tax=Calycina marina TaxID=1763456 RepID=A0A9P7YXA6_9HELO|nr:Hamartin protein-domain-containing protein [Calycina marina]